MNTFKLYNGDCLEVLRKCPDNYIDAIVTDPPYGLSFMGKKWDYDVPSVEIWKECLRVLKPGGHLLAFGGARTYHRLVVAIEDAGFEIRDQIQWIYGQGFPKSQDISKAIDKAAGAERKVVGSKFGLPGYSMKQADESEVYGEGLMNGPKKCEITAPTTPEAKQWSGWGTALKPANEPICLARKPLSEKTVAANVLKWGTGGLNIDESRIALDDGANLEAKQRSQTQQSGHTVTLNVPGHEQPTYNPQGRFPSNVILDEAAAEVLDGQTGVSGSGSGTVKVSSGKKSGDGTWASKGGMQQPGKENTGVRDFGDSGGASRFFYVAKASKSDRGEGNIHPTVKPIKLMEYLCKLVTPPGGVVLDPFMGSGTTGVAALRNGFQFRGIEREEQYFYISQARLEKEQGDAE